MEIISANRRFLFSCGEDNAVVVGCIFRVSGVVCLAYLCAARLSSSSMHAIPVAGQIRLIMWTGFFSPGLFDRPYRVSCCSGSGSNPLRHRYRYRATDGRTQVALILGLEPETSVQAGLPGRISGHITGPANPAWQGSAS
jgi:hypothetical protein